MHSGSGVKQAAATARRAALFVLLGTAAIVSGFLAERTYFHAQSRAADTVLAEAHRSADLILVADERLRMSANLATATGEGRWLDHYDVDAAQIGEAMAAASRLAPPAVAKRFDAEAQVASDRLIELDRQAFEALRRGDTPIARATLAGEDYAQYETMMNDGVSHFVDGVAASVSARLDAVEHRALTALSGLLLVLIAGALVLWRALDASLQKSAVALSQAERAIQTLAMNDVLTGLGNRVSLREALHAAIGRADRNRTKLAVLMIDLDRFKPINDRHGHLIGDLVLKEVAHRMARILRRGEVRARYGGDEFVAVVEYGRDDLIPQRVGRRLIEELSEPMLFDGLTVHIGASVGFAAYPTDARNEEDLIRKADIALNHAKEDGHSSVRLYDSSMDTDTDARAQLETELREAIAGGDVVPYFQPLVDLVTGELRGFEVLSRWNHATRGQVAPADFIPLAESSGQIGALTMAVLKTACREALALPNHLSIAINVAPQQIEDEWLAPGILAILHETGFPAHRLEIELTEHALVEELASAKRVFASLKSVGIQIALDDFGTGYSSLCYLSELPFDKIKIDRSFIKTLLQRAESAKIVNAIVGLGKSLGVPTIAEGVETEREAAFLRDIGCPLAQGFLYSMPVPAVDLPNLIAAFSSATERRAVA